VTQLHDKAPWFRRSYLADNLSSLADLQYRCRFSHSEAAAFLGVTVRTYRRWLASEPPPWARLLLAIRAGFVPWDGWQDWQVVNEGIIPPGYSDPVAPGDIMAVPFQLQQIAELRRQVREFVGLDDQAAFNAEVLRRHTPDD
jgi:transcriptional regulator with XRE-family HTH domain